ncbi:uncharacterized protein LOC132616852 [Lycium barbarum]|uniref:uncharacterized protein LOC132616852 n=1 Tax=Lycium barbarum TaxID=112863 RepID=UPI00293EE1B1|nr:uncharacterized protein LOC132616852 [Lycium barbarum]
MAGYQILGAILQDGHSTTRPPYFNGEHYCHWKERFKIFVQSTDYQAWVVIKKGPKPIPRADTENKEDAETSTIDLESHDITKEQQETLQINARAIALLYCAVSGEEYAKISNCDTAKEMWDKLETMRTSNQCSQDLARSLENSQQVRKLVRSLPKTWETKAIVLEDGNLDMFTYDELRGNLIAFEKNHIQRYQKDEKKKVVAFKAQVEESDDDFKEEEVAMISRHVIEAMRRSTNNRKGSSNFRKGKTSTGQQKTDGNWSEDEISDEESEEIENVCFMALEQSSKGLKYNLLSVNQLCDSDLEIRFSKSGCVIEDSSGIKILPGSRNKNVYTLDSVKNPKGHICLASMGEDLWVWHKNLGHASMRLIEKLARHDLVIGLSKLNYTKEHLCDSCQKGKQTRNFFSSKDIVSTSKPLQLLHMDLVGPTRTASIGGKRYAFVIIDDFSRFTWVIFLAHKDDTLKNFKFFCEKIQREKGYYITSIRSDHGGEFENKAFEEFCNDQGYTHNFSSPRSPQQNGVVERNNRTLQDMERTMIIETSLPHHFWAKAENLGKFDPRSDEGIFLGYSPTSRSYRIYNKRTLSIEESIHVVFDDTNHLVEKRKIANEEDSQILTAVVTRPTEEKAPFESTSDAPQSTDVTIGIVPNEW